MVQDRFESRDRMFEMNDEYDVQDFMHGLLVASFDDVRPEDYVPSHASRNSRLDFLLFDEEIGFELKMTRESLSENDLSEQLIIDIERYRTHPRCKELVFLVYDPKHRVRNPQGIKTSLEGPRGGVNVHIVIVS